MQDRSTPVYEIVVILIAVGAATAAIAGSTGLPDTAFGAMGPGALPTAVAVIILALCAAIAVPAFVRLRSGSPAGKAATARRAARGAARLSGMGALCLAMALVFEYRFLSFGYAAALFLLGGFLVLGARSGRHLWAGIILAVAAAYGIAFVFTNIVYVDLP